MAVTRLPVVGVLGSGRPLIAYLRARDEIPDLPDAVRAERDLEKVKAFARERIA